MHFTDTVILHELSDNVPMLPLRRYEHPRAAVLALFREHNRAGSTALQSLSPRQWKPLLHWLDTSGLALYLLDRLRERGMLGALPLPVLLRLQRNLDDNTERTAALVDECCAIHRELAEAGIPYAVLKGFSLWPHSVSRLELRSQLDLDFLVVAADESRAQRVLERRGYRLQAVSGRSREFKTPYGGSLRLSDLYRPSRQRTVEVHLEEQGSGLLRRCEHHMLHDISVPVLSAEDLFLDQALHLYKHLSRDQMRCSHLLELYRHLLARSGDRAFWARVEALCAAEPKMAACVGVALDFVAQQIEPTCVPPKVRRWTVDRVPVQARLWIRRYGARVATASFPGTKLHLLLQEAMAHGGVVVGRSIGSSLLPRRLPPRIAIPPTGETVSEALCREFRQGRFVLARLRFHLREGVCFLIERARWHRLLNGALTASSNPLQSTTKPLHTASFGAATKP